MMMKKESTAEMLARIAEESEATKDAPIPDPLPEHVLEYRGTRVNTLQIRLNDAELEALSALAKQRGLPPSTVARGLLVAAMRPKQSIAQALERIENDVQTLRGQLVNA